tara:strand:- start:417 stop:1814 length:1398 start_codon:yes stop_codon:yes gene_type:complete
MKNISFLFIIFFCFSCTSLGPFKRGLQKKDLKKFISSSIKKSELSKSIAVKVVSLDNGETLFEHNSKKLMTPASNVKLFTSAASLHYLGREHVFETAILKSKSNIILVGGADPELSLKVIDSLAGLVSKNLSLIDTLFIDGGLFDDRYYGKGWMWDEGSEEYSAPVNALVLNSNCIDFEYSPNEIGLPAKVNTYPKTDHITLENNSITVNDTVDFKKLRIDRNWVDRSNEYLITGEILQWSEKDTVKKNIEKPNLFFGTVFKELLESHGLTVNELFIGNTIGLKDTILIHRSRPLYNQLEEMMHDSRNLTSELLLKYMGITDSTIGNWQGGIRKVKTYLQDEVKIDTSALSIADGSGLSRYNLLSASQIVKLLAHIHGQNNGDVYVNTLPNGNEKNSSLEGRLLQTQDKIFAKTGSLSGVSCLSGYAFSPNHGPMAFSILINGFVGSMKPHRKFQDELCAWLVRD